MAGDGDVIDIVHSRAADAGIIPQKTERFDQIDGHAQAGSEAQDGADIAGNFRFKQRDAHSQRRLPTARWMRLQASSSTASDVA